MRTVTRTFAMACALAVLLVGGCGGQDADSSQEVLPAATPGATGRMSPESVPGTPGLPDGRGPSPGDTTSRSIFDSPTGIFDG
ncbi:hypothetical protein ACFY1U_11475 [Streptomyces sp. NPDC001351]|uniref:hypothetical protein n=1 Tax=Streptomyces sp. NPDC001351 TaxID=3364564 RepID=UPI0036CEA5B5